MCSMQMLKQKHSLCIFFPLGIQCIGEALLHDYGDSAKAPGKVEICCICREKLLSDILDFLLEENIPNLGSQTRRARRG